MMARRLNTYLQDARLRFSLRFSLYFITLYYFNVLFTGLSTAGNYYLAGLDRHFNYIKGLRYMLIETSAAILRIFGHSVTTTDFTMHVYNRGGISVVYSCLGLGVMSFFTAFVLAWPGRPLKSKGVFIIGGLMLIQVLNVLRFMLIALYWRELSFPGIINHHTLFNSFLYAVVLYVMYRWSRAGSENDYAQP